MKKTLFSVVIIAVVLAIAVPFIYARGSGSIFGRGYHGMGFSGHGPGYGYMMSDEQRSGLSDLHKKFYEDTAALREEVRQKELELDALMAEENPDEAKILAKSKELSAAREKLSEKGVRFRIENRDQLRDLPGSGQGFGGGRGYRMGRGFGPGMGGYGPGNCPRGF